MYVEKGESFYFSSFSWTFNVNKTKCQQISLKVIKKTLNSNIFWLTQILTAEYFTNYFIRAGSKIGTVSKYGRVKFDLKLINARAFFWWYTVIFMCSIYQCWYICICRSIYIAEGLVIVTSNLKTYY
jgi:hypothetical protein